ncbi:MAG: penicillin acylase family protein, partial [Gammaproteobacteria bacterium]|nr:penicillin acylase family protein [Gammaproteobacteria bacterium]
MKRLLLWLAGGAVCLVVVLGVIVWLGLRASLPQLDGEVSVAGLSSPVSVERDADGIPVITASNRMDLAFATGYVHGQDRFFQ